MSISNLKNNDIYNNLQKNKKKLVKLSLLVLVLGITINAFAWLTSTNEANVDAEADVSSWIVRFTDEENVEVKDVTYNLWMKPGMNTYTKTITATNEGTTPAEVTSELTGFTVLGTTIDITQPNYKDKFPFEFDFLEQTITLAPNGTVDLEFNVDWDFEDTSKYFHADDFYGYYEDFIYYTLDGTNYVEDNTVTAANYNSKKANLYVYKDDIDTYFGQECGEYQTATSKPCITFSYRYKATQAS